MLKNNKAPGSDLITAQVLKSGGEPIVNMLHLIFLKTVNEENTPLYFSKMLVIPVLKKGSKCLPKNCRAISLLSIPGKVLNKILLNKIPEKTGVYTSDQHYGFRPNRDTVDAIFIETTNTKSKKGIKYIYHFVDFKSAFDTISKKALWKMMRSIGINKSM